MFVLLSSILLAGWMNFVFGHRIQIANWFKIFWRSLGAPSLLKKVMRETIFFRVVSCNPSFLSQAFLFCSLTLWWKAVLTDFLLFRQLRFVFTGFVFICVYSLLYLPFFSVFGSVTGSRLPSPKELSVSPEVVQSVLFWSALVENFNKTRLVICAGNCFHSFTSLTQNYLATIHIWFTTMPTSCGPRQVWICRGRK